MIYTEYVEKAKKIPFGDKGSEERKEYHQRHKDVNNEFKAALEEEYGTKGNPKADKLWEKAWEMGHSNGFYEVEGCYDELSELII